MSLDVTNKTSQKRTLADARSGVSSAYPESKDQWKSFRKKIRVRAEKQSVASVFGNPAKGGSIYRWGVAAALADECSESIDIYSRLAGSTAVRKKDLRGFDFESSAVGLIERLSGGVLEMEDAIRAITCGAAMPELIDHLDYQLWWDLLSELQQFRELALERGNASSLSRLMVGGELGLTLAWRLADLPSCSRLRKSSTETVVRWCKHDEDSLAECIVGAKHSRIALATLLRSKRIMENVHKAKFKKQPSAVLADLATWVAATTTHSGGCAFSEAPPTRFRDDTKKHGLLDAAIECDKDSLAPAMSAARGKSQTGGRLVWEVSLPESMHHCDEAKLAVMMPEWDVRRGRTHIDYSRRDIRLEMFSGKTRVFLGTIQTSVDVADHEQRAIGGWVSTCEYSDDDVHYLELEQPWTGDLVLQRQFLVVRDDRCVLMADSVLPNDSKQGRAGPQSSTGPEIRYTSRIPLAVDIVARAEPETRELFLEQKNASALAIPLSANEWRVGPTQATLRATEDNHLLLSATGKGRLYAPLWLDFQRRRFKYKRTWRQLTVGDELRIVGANEAVGYRVQSGSEQWMIYRSLGELRPRTVLGKHLVADFYAGRFHLNDGSLEELVTVDENDK